MKSTATNVWRRNKSKPSGWIVRGCECKVVRLGNRDDRRGLQGGVHSSLGRGDGVGSNQGGREDRRVIVRGVQVNLGDRACLVVGQGQVGVRYDLEQSFCKAGWPDCDVVGYTGVFEGYDYGVQIGLCHARVERVYAETMLGV